MARAKRRTVPRARPSRRVISRRLCPSASRAWTCWQRRRVRGTSSPCSARSARASAESWCRSAVDRRRRLRLRGGVQAAVVAGDGLLDVLGEVVPQMPPIGDLNSLWRTHTGALGIGVSAIPADDLHAGMPPEPSGEGAGFAVGQNVDRPAGLDVDQHSRIPVPSAEREIIHAQGGERSGLGCDAKVSRVSGSPGRDPGGRCL